MLKKEWFWGSVIVIAIILGSLIYFYFVEQWAVASKLFGKTEDHKGEYLKLLIPVYGAIFVAGGFYLNFRRTKALDKQNKIAGQGKIDERFKNAIEHLGSDNSAIVFGGIHSLYRVAKEDKSYREPVFNILCSYIRDKNAISKHEGSEEPISIVIQTIINVLFKETGEDEYIFNGLKADLSESYLVRANLRWANLERAELVSANLERALLESASLLFADLTGAYLVSVDLTGACLSFAKLIEVFSISANLTYADLTEANLTYADLTGADLTRADLTRADFANTEFDPVIFEDAKNVDKAIFDDDNNPLKPKHDE